MRPKEKAKELVDKMLDKQEYSDVYQERGIISWSAKQCALIAVDEIVNCDSYFNTLAEAKEFINYWYEVQQEIEKI
jgi:hypothetical protein